MTFEEEVEASHEARIRILTKYGSFVLVEELLKKLEPVEEETVGLERKFSKSYSLNQFDLFKRV